MSPSKAQEQKLREEKSRTDSRQIYQGRVIGLCLDTYRIHDQMRVYEIIHHPGAIVIVPVDSKGRIYLVQQWRRAVGQIMTELPAGTLEEGEEPLACAQRELQEEIGFSARKMTSMMGFYSAPGFCDEYLHLFLAEDLIASRLPADDDEGIDVISLSLPEALQKIEQGQIIDAKSIAGILRYALSKR
jgi:ADP-ribose pyrophosphatase